MRDTLKKLPFRFRPAIVDALKDYSGKKFYADLNSGITVGLVAIPLALAFAIASGMDPVAGLVTAVVAGFIVAVLGGSRFQIAGPTGAFVPILAGIVAVYGRDNLLVCSCLAGMMLVLLGLSGLGKVIKYIPYPVTMGFTSGIAVIIFSGQIGDFLGLPIKKLEPEFLQKMAQYAENLTQLNWAALAIGAAVVALMVWWPARWQKRIPSSMAGLIAAGLAVKCLGLNVVTIGSKWGIPSGFPMPHLPVFQWHDLPSLLLPSLKIALLGAIESLLSAVVADSLTNTKHDSNQELVAQGLANICSPFFGGIAATGAIARTGTNIRSGAVTPVSGIVHSVTLLLIMLVAAPLANAIPLSALAAVLLVVSFRMGEWHEFKRLRRVPRSDAIVFLVAFSLTVLVDLTWGVLAGIALAGLFVIMRVSESSEITALDEAHPASGDRPVWADESWPEGVYLFRVQGAFFFGSADMLETSLRRAGAQLRVMILLCEDVFSIDATGLNALESLRERLRQKQHHLILCKISRQPLQALKKAGFIEALGADNVTHSIDEALQRARSLLYERADKK